MPHPQSLQIVCSPLWPGQWQKECELWTKIESSNSRSGPFSTLAPSNLSFLTYEMGVILPTSIRKSLRILDTQVII